MLMPCLLAQAVCFIHLFGLQLCVAMRPTVSGSSSSTQNLGCNLGDMKVVFLILVLNSDFNPKYYVTVSDISHNGKKMLQLTKDISDALPIGNYSGPRDDLPVVRCFQNCSVILMDDG
jgi:hypothetical protein